MPGLRYRHPGLVKRIFADGFEVPCNLADLDGDRLSECAESITHTDPTLVDTDGDGLSDGDEVLGTLAGLNLPAMGVDPRHKDILLEYDWFEEANEAGTGLLCPANSTHSHRPTQAMLDIVTVMFGAAPIANPNGVPGINVIHDFGQGGVFTGGNLVADADGVVQGGVLAPEYVATYHANFASNRRGYFHYVLLPHRYVTNTGQNSSGNAEIHGDLFNDSMMVSLYCATTSSNVGNTIAHELGHNLRLHHGGAGDDACNEKPNYNSIMNYRFQFDGVDDDCDYGHPAGNPADFSRGVRLPVDEALLTESSGMCAGLPTDWNVDGDRTDVLANYDLNGYAKQTADCGGEITVLTDHDDWGSLGLPIVNGTGNGAGDDEVLLTADCPGPVPIP